MGPEFWDVLPLLASSYQRGHLVPFIGAGMSAPMLTVWDGFVKNLESESGLEDLDWNSSNDVKAQRACDRMRNGLGRACFADQIRTALKSERFDSGVPLQTTRLASMRWPLVISTNYDDLFYGEAVKGDRARAARMEILSRSPLDCKRAVSSLSGPLDREFIWHVQGFLGGQHPGFEPPIPEAQVEAFRDELVIGHSEYRRVSNNEPHFRRCFGEVFASRSFLFLGSSILEPYFLNLFDEFLSLLGPSPVPHFAIAEKGKADRQFLSAQMNITVCEFEPNRWEILPEWLGMLARAVERPVARSARWAMTVSAAGGRESILEIVPGNAPTEITEAKQAIAVIAPHGQEVQPAIADKTHKEEWRSKFTGLAFADGQVVRSRIGNYYAISAEYAGGESDRDVGKAIQELLKETTEHECESVHLQLPNEGGSVPPVYAFMEAVRAFGSWKKDHPVCTASLHLYVGIEVELNLRSDRMDIPELLTSEFLRFWVVMSPAVLDHLADPVRRVLFYRPEVCLVDVLKDLDVPVNEEWSASICPSPRHYSGLSTTEALQHKKLVDVGIVFGSVMTLTRCEPNKCPPRV